MQRRHAGGILENVWDDLVVLVRVRVRVRVRARARVRALVLGFGLGLGLGLRGSGLGFGLGARARPYQQLLDHCVVVLQVRGDHKVCLAHNVREAHIVKHADQLGLLGGRDVRQILHVQHDNDRNDGALYLAQQRGRGAGSEMQGQVWGGWLGGTWTQTGS